MIFKESELEKKKMRVVKQLQELNTPENKKENREAQLKVWRRYKDHVHTTDDLIMLQCLMLFAK